MVLVKTQINESLHKELKHISVEKAEDISTIVARLIEKFVAENRETHLILCKACKNIYGSSKNQVVFKVDTCEEHKGKKLRYASSRD